MNQGYCVRIWMKGNDRSSGRLIPGVFQNADEAVNGLRNQAEGHVLRQSPERGDYICELIHGATSHVVHTYRLQKEKRTVIFHHPGCGCNECKMLMHPEQLVPFL